MKTFGQMMAAEEQEATAKTAALRRAGELHARLALLAPRSAPLARSGMVPVVVARINSLVRLADTYRGKAHGGSDRSWGRADLLLAEALRECSALEQAIADAERAAFDTSLPGVFRRASLGLLVEGTYPTVHAFLAALGPENAVAAQSALERGLGIHGEGLADWWSSPRRTAGEKLLAVDRAIVALSAPAFAAPSPLK